MNFRILACFLVLTVVSAGWASDNGKELTKRQKTLRNTFEAAVWPSWFQVVHSHQPLQAVQRQQFNHNTFMAGAFSTGVSDNLFKCNDFNSIHENFVGDVTGRSLPREESGISENIRSILDKSQLITDIVNEIDIQKKSLESIDFGAEFKKIQDERPGMFRQVGMSLLGGSLLALALKPELIKHVPLSSIQQPASKIFSGNKRWISAIGAVFLLGWHLMQEYSYRWGKYTKANFDGLKESIEFMKTSLSSQRQLWNIIRNIKFDRREAEEKKKNK